MSAGLTEAVKAAARKEGADLIGIANIERFDGVPANHHPQSIFPETRSVIVVAKRITRGCIRGVEEGTQLGTYNRYAMNWVRDRVLSLITLTTASYLEDNGWEASPLPELPKQTPAMGIPVREGVPPPNVMVDFEDAAVRAGLGVIGLTGEFMSPEYGHLQRMQLILTDAELDPTPLCETSVCDQCGACVAACPLNAIDGESKTPVAICGKTFDVAAIDKDVCLLCKNGMWPNPYHDSGDPDRKAAACMRACMAHLEEQGALSKSFKSPFRKRPAWQVDLNGRSTLVEEAVK